MPLQIIKSNNRNINNYNTNNRNYHHHELSLREKENVVAMDCEMVGVGPYGHRSALARVTIVSYDHHILFDAYIKVNEPVTDFRTFVSGISPCDLLSDKAVSLDDARVVVRSIIKRKILVGHGLKCDLTALSISHPWYNIRDTANYFPYMKQGTTLYYNSGAGNCSNNQSKEPRKLKDLARHILGWNIQDDNRANGHCSYEDAVASMALYKVARLDWEGLMKWKINKTRNIVQKKLHVNSSNASIATNATTSTSSSCDDWSTSNSDCSY